VAASGCGIEAPVREALEDEVISHQKMRRNSMGPSDTKTFTESRATGNMSKIQDNLRDMVTRCGFALGTGADSLSVLKKNKNTTDEQKKEIDKHIKELGLLCKIAQTMLAKITKLTKEDPKNYSDMNALIKANTAFFKSAAEFQDNAPKLRGMLKAPPPTRPASAKPFYHMSGPFKNVSMNSIDGCVDRIVTHYRKMMSEFGYHEM
jgi:hypothetical protein